MTDTTKTINFREEGRRGGGPTLVVAEPGFRLKCKSCITDRGEETSQVINPIILNSVQVRAGLDGESNSGMHKGEEIPNISRCTHNVGWGIERPRGLCRMVLKVRRSIHVQKFYTCARGNIAPMQLRNSCYTHLKQIQLYNCIWVYIYAIEVWNHSAGNHHLR